MKEFGVILIGPYATKDEVVDDLVKVNLIIDEILPNVRMQWQPSGMVGTRTTVESMMGMKIESLKA